ncbi:hypothetical protein SAMN04487905_108122 [Actinopolyspora xinjiangensis]|uniref:Secreted protein n=1 Tax=Actinopolyspora xinjiangensis TaxID=405564 RepID=A0A1H0VAQ5_9ACTN|nr:hypothetical protein [Actinopolyspora xinjiangensis]SDP75315.1 hypothetical protein SAMN04487905_108122 [Actinopolyspora xinjiangensis]
MQTWARRGMQAALVTGGMIAAGTGVASASGNCPERPTSPLGDPLTPAEAAGDGTPSRSGLCFAGELFPEGDGGWHETVSNATADTLVGVVEPIRDVQPEGDNEATQRIPRITDVPSPGLEETAEFTTEQQWIPPRAGPAEGFPTEPARPGLSTKLPELSWRTDVGRAGNVRSEAPFTAQPRERSRGRHAAQESRPADGFHRSLSWSGPIGHVVETFVEGARHVDESTATILPALVTPAHDPAVAPELAAPRGGVSGTASSEAPGVRSGLLATDSIDLTRSGLDTGPDLRTVPRESLRSALSARTGGEHHRGEESAPLQLPDEALQRAEEVPALVAPELLVSEVPSTDGDPGVAEPLREFNAFGGNVETGSFSRIARELTVDGTAALAEHGSEPSEVAFTDTPELSPVVVRVVDELTTALPEREQVAANPFRERPSARGAAPAVGMALPVLSGASKTDVLDGHTYPLPALDTEGMPKAGAANNEAWPRQAYSRV